jgi:hypothetical protein
VTAGLVTAGLVTAAGRVRAAGWRQIVDLTIPLATLLGLAGRAGEADWPGAIDPGLARDLAARAAAHPASTFRIIITGPDGYATGFGLARRTPGRTGRRKPGRDRPPPGPAPPASTRGSTPMATLTPASPQPALPGLGTAARDGRAGPGQAGSAGGLGGLGTWRIRIGDLHLTAGLHPITRDECGHELATTACQPTALLQYIEFYMFSCDINAWRAALDVLSLSKGLRLACARSGRLTGIFSSLRP